MRILTKTLGVLALLIVLPAFGSGERVFAPGADLWERWGAHDPASTRRIDHGAWQGFLDSALQTPPEGAALVAYDDVTPAARGALDGYLEQMAAAAVSGLNRAEQLAYWINLYNALTVRVVLDHGPVASIRDIDISPGLFASGPWGKALISVEGEALSLNDIEHRILRPIWADARIHYAVNCASIGCPNLAATAYDGASVDRALTEAAIAYVNDPRGVTVSAGQISVSRIYDWFIEDFGGTEASVIAHLTLYARPELRAALAAAGKLDTTHYDWSLNGVR